MVMVISSLPIMLLICIRWIQTTLLGYLHDFLLDLEKSHASRSLFENARSTPLYEAVLYGKYACLDSLPTPPNEHVIEKKLPPTMWVQLDNCAKDNKNIFVVA